MEIDTFKLKELAMAQMIEKTLEFNDFLFDQTDSFIKLYYTTLKDRFTEYGNGIAQGFKWYGKWTQKISLI